MNKEKITAFIENENGFRINLNNELSTRKVIINNIEITSIEDWNKVVDSISKLQQKNKQLQERIEYLERSNNRREDTILEQRQKISDLEDNWNKLKEIAKSRSGLKKQCYNGGLWFEIDDLLDKMQEIEGSDE